MNLGADLGGKGRGGALRFNPRLALACPSPSIALPVDCRGMSPLGRALGGPSIPMEGGGNEPAVEPAVEGGEEGEEPSAPVGDDTPPHLG